MSFLPNWSYFKSINYWIDNIPNKCKFQFLVLKTVEIIAFKNGQRKYSNTNKVLATKKNEELDFGSIKKGKTGVVIPAYINNENSYKQLLRLVNSLKIQTISQI